jgi:hypothetical protein
MGRHGPKTIGAFVQLFYHRCGMVIAADSGSISSLLSSHWTFPKVGFRQPHLVSAGFTAEEEALINRKGQQVGRCWTLIARMLDTRTVNEVMNRWKMVAVRRDTYRSTIVMVSWENKASA